jgi:drug/metabolite transporter (DMT)-like permease
MSIRLRADLILILTAVVWGSAFIAQRVVAQAGSVFIFNGSRFLIASLILMPFLRKRKMFAPNQALWMGVAGVILFVASALQQAGLQNTTAGNAGFFTGLYVVLVPLVMLAVWGELPHWTAWVAVAFAGLGGFLLSTNGRFEIKSGDALELAGALFWAIHIAILGKFASRFNPIAFSVGQFFVGGALNLLVGVFCEKVKISNTDVLIIAILYTAVFSVTIGYTLQVWAQRHTAPTDAAIIMSLEAIFAAAFGWWLLHERLEPIQMLGCGLILSAVALSQIKPFSIRKE